MIVKAKVKQNQTLIKGDQDRFYSAVLKQEKALSSIPNTAKIPGNL